MGPYARVRSNSPSPSSPTRQPSSFGLLPKSLQNIVPARFGRRELILSITILCLLIGSTFWISPPNFAVADYLPRRPGSYAGSASSSLSSISGLFSSSDRVAGSVGNQEYDPEIELDGVVLGPSFTSIISEARTSSDSELLHVLSKALEDRFNSLTNDDEANVAIPVCPALDLSRYEPSYIFTPPSPGMKKPALSVALNLHQSERILPALSMALLSTLWHMRTSHDIHISIFENGSDDRTSLYLGQLAAALLAIPNQAIKSLTFRSSNLRRADETERITALAGIRNEAVLPLIPFMIEASSNITSANPRDRSQGTLLFVNDVITCPLDLLELIHQLHLQTADVACSTDWNLEHEGPDDNKETQAQFYDKWVSRGINGLMPYPVVDESPWNAPTGQWTSDLWSTQDENIHSRWLDGRPIPLYSGWNGAIAARASLFTQQHVRFRASGIGGWRGGDADGKMGPWGRLVATKGYLESDCPASECKLFARDIWHLLKYSARFVLASQSRTTYSIEEWNELVNDCKVTVPPTFRRQAYGKPAVTSLDNENAKRVMSKEEDLQEELIDWSVATMPDEVACVSGLTPEGKYQNPFYHDEKMWVPTYVKAKFEWLG